MRWRRVRPGLDVISVLVLGSWDLGRRWLLWAVDRGLIFKIIHLRKFPLTLRVPMEVLSIHDQASETSPASGTSHKLRLYE